MYSQKIKGILSIYVTMLGMVQSISVLQTPDSRLVISRCCGHLHQPSRPVSGDWPCVLCFVKLLTASSVALSFFISINFVFCNAVGVYVAGVRWLIIGISDFLYIFYIVCTATQKYFGDIRAPAGPNMFLVKNRK